MTSWWPPCRCSRRTCDGRSPGTRARRWPVIPRSPRPSRRPPSTSATRTPPGSGPPTRTRTGDGGPDRPPPTSSDEALFGHQPGDPLAADVLAVPDEGGRDPRRAIRAATGSVDLDDRAREFCVRAGAWAGLMAMPDIERGARDLHQGAGLRHRALCCLLRRDERVDAHRVSLLLLCQAASCVRPVMVSERAASSTTRRRKTSSESRRRSRRRASVFVEPAAMRAAT